METSESSPDDLRWRKSVNWGYSKPWYLRKLGIEHGCGRSRQ